MKKVLCSALCLLVVVSGCSSAAKPKDSSTDLVTTLEDGSTVGVTDDVDVYMPIAESYDVTYTSEDADWAAHKIQMGSGVLEDIPTNAKLNELGYTVLENRIDRDGTIVYEDSEGNQLVADYISSDWESGEIFSLRTRDNVTIFGDSLKVGMSREDVIESFGQPCSSTIIDENTTRLGYHDEDRTIAIILILSSDKLKSVQVEYQTVGVGE